MTWHPLGALGLLVLAGCGNDPCLSWVELDETYTVTLREGDVGVPQDHTCSPNFDLQPGSTFTLRAEKEAAGTTCDLVEGTATVPGVEFTGEQNHVGFTGPTPLLSDHFKFAVVGGACRGVYFIGLSGDDGDVAYRYFSTESDDETLAPCTVAESTISAEYPGCNDFWRATVTDSRGRVVAGTRE